MDYARQPGKFIPILFAFILLFSVFLRINAPEADLPADISFSGSIATDEGNQCHNSRSKALFNEWYPDDWKVTNYNPILPWFKLTSFKLFGVGLWQLRAVNHLFALLTLVFFYLSIKSAFSPLRWPALTGLALLGVHFLYVMYNKIGTFETSITFWVVLCLYFLEKHRASGKNVFLVLCGAAAFTAFIFKSIMAYALPLPFAAAVVITAFNHDSNSPRFKSAIRILLPLAAGFLAAAIPWYFFHYLPNKSWIVGTAGEYMSNLMFPKHFGEAWRNFLTFNWKDQFYKSPVIWCCAPLAIPFYFRRLFSRRAQWLETGYILFFFAHTFMFMFISYRPTRYFVPVIPAMVFMTVMLLRQMIEVEKEERPIFKPLTWFFMFLLDAAWLTLAGLFCFLPLASRLLTNFTVPEPSLKTLAAGAGVMAVLHLLRFLIRKRPPSASPLRFVAPPLAVLLIGVSLYVDLSRYWSWNRDKTYQIRDMSRELGEKIPNAYIAGMTAPVAVLNNRCRALWLFPNFVNWGPDTFTKYPLSHGLLGADISREIEHYFNTWPELMERARLLKVYPVKDYNVHLYSFIDPFIRAAYLRAEAGPEAVLSIINPGAQTVRVHISRILLPQWQTDPHIASLDALPGENTLTVSLDGAREIDPDQWFFYLETEPPFQTGPLRYEGENCRTRAGEVVIAPDASNRRTMTYFHKKKAPGFLCYGPAVPFAPGVVTAEFNLRFTNLETKLKPLCRIDIYSREDKRFLTQWVIRPSDIRKDGRHGYSVSTVLHQTRALEFRVSVEDQADVALDYIDADYRQGAFADN